MVISQALESDMGHYIKVLSIDGGGIRGIIPAMILSDIEKRTKTPIAKLFHLIAGTSTGGILALALTKPDAQGKPEYRAEKLIGFYQTEGKRIFSCSTVHKVQAVWSLWDERYLSEGIEGVLHQYFGEARLKDAVTDVLIASYEIERRVPYFFKTTDAKTKEGCDFSMEQVARATSAAPTYFEPLKIEIKNSTDYFALIDGGVFANNPAMCAFVEAKSIYSHEDDFLVVSLGTGELTRTLPYEKAKHWGLAAWAKPLLSVIFDGVSDTVDYQLKRLLPPGKDGRIRYYRFQARLDKPNDDMDDVSPENIRSLSLLGEALIRDNDQTLDILCDQLTK